MLILGDTKLAPFQPLFPFPTQSRGQNTQKPHENRKKSRKALGFNLSDHQKVRRRRGTRRGAYGSVLEVVRCWRVFIRS
ncbi:hypothetical protein V6Z11_A05G445000 [Gossypium hirsutum]